MRDRITTSTTKDTSTFDFDQTMKAMADMVGLPAKPHDGRIIVVDDKEAIVDPISGAMYVTRTTWDALRLAVPETKIGPASPEGPAGQS